MIRLITVFALFTAISTGCAFAQDYQPVDSDGNVLTSLTLAGEDRLSCGDASLEFGFATEKDERGNPYALLAEMSVCGERTQRAAIPKDDFGLEIEVQTSADIDVIVIWVCGYTENQCICVPLNETV